MPTIITHSVIAVTSGVAFGKRNTAIKFLMLSIICSVIPDADVIGYQYLYIPYGHFFGHRGFFHSPFFAAFFSLFVVGLFYRDEKIFSLRWWLFLLYFFVITASHGFLDAMTNGGRGIALLSPMTNNRYFLPWRPIEVSPLSIKSFLSKRGWIVLKNEMLWIWLPSVIILIFARIIQKVKSRQ